MMGGFESGETEGLRDGTHDENVGDGINIAEFFAANETGKNDIARDAEIGGETYEPVFFFAVAGENENELGVFGDSKSGGMHEIV